VKLAIEKNGDGEKVNALNKAIKDLIDFIEFGGEVDFIVPIENNGESERDENTQKPEYENLKSTIHEIRLLEDKLKLLESPFEEDDSE
jgi:hypothetical protein